MASMCLYALPTTSGNAPDRRSLGDFLSDLDWFISQFLDSLWCYVVVVQQYMISQGCWIVFIIQELLPPSSHMRLSAVVRRRNPGPTAAVWQDLILVPLTSLMSVWSSKDIQHVSLDHHWPTGKQVTLEEAAGRVFSTASPDSVMCYVCSLRNRCCLLREQEATGKSASAWVAWLSAGVIL